MLSPIPVIEVPKNWNYFLFGDGHIGTRLRVQKAWNKLIDMMNSPYDGVKHNLGTDHGDMIDAIDISDKRFSFYESREATILAQMDTAKREYWPIRKKLVCILDGNHPRKHWVFGRITERICKEIGVLYGTYSTVIVFKNKDTIQFRHYAHHGSGSIKSVADDPERRKLNMLLALKRKLSPMFGSALLMSMGHTHRLMKSPPTEELYLTEDNGKIEHGYTPYAPYLPNEFIHPNYRWYVNTGSFMRLYDDNESGSGYAERAMYGPLEIGFCIAKIRDNMLDGVDKIIL